MEYGVFLWKTYQSSSPEIDTLVEANDPVAAALSVMDRFGLRSAFHVFVYDGNYSMKVAEFIDVDLSVSPTSSADCLMLYDSL